MVKNKRIEKKIDKQKFMWYCMTVGSKLYYTQKKKCPIKKKLV